MAKHYKLSNTEMTVTADWAKLDAKEKATVKEFIELGYRFQNKNSRNGTKRTASYYENNLIQVDKDIFDQIRNTTDGTGKKVKGAYSKASSFASTIIKLGKHVDENPDEKNILDEYRTLAINDFVQAKVYAKNVLDAA